MSSESVSWLWFDVVCGRVATWPHRVVSSESDESRECDGGAELRRRVQQRVTDLLILTRSAVPSSRALPTAARSLRASSGLRCRNIDCKRPPWLCEINPDTELSLFRMKFSSDSWMCVFRWVADHYVKTWCERNFSLLSPELHRACLTAVTDTMVSSSLRVISSSVFM